MYDDDADPLTGCVECDAGHFTADTNTQAFLETGATDCVPCMQGQFDGDNISSTPCVAPPNSLALPGLDLSDDTATSDGDEPPGCDDDCSECCPCDGSLPHSECRDSPWLVWLIAIGYRLVVLFVAGCVLAVLLLLCVKKRRAKVGLANDDFNRGGGRSGTIFASNPTTFDSS